jgi:hypothetical protein
MTTDLPVVDGGKPRLQVEPFRQFDTFDAAYIWTNNTVNALIGNGETVILSRIAADRFKKPRQRQAQLFGVSPKAAKEAAKIAPGGKWWVEHSTDGQNRHQFMAWYSRYLLYAYAMMTSEDGFEAMGVDYDSINSYYKSCMGFVYLGQGDIEVKFTCANPLAVLASGGNIEDYRQPSSGNVFVFPNTDLELYEELYHATCKLSPPNLPWDEAYRPAFCFVAFQRPELFVKYIQGRKGSRQEALDDYRTKLVLKVAEYLNKPVPDFKWK